MTKSVILHVGTHKTGSTSITEFLREHDADLLAAVGAHYPAGFLVPFVHTELPLAVIRPERTWPARLRFPETMRQSWLDAARRYVKEEVASDRYDRLVYVHEDLSYLRFDDEFVRLRELFEGRPVTVVLFLRDRAAFVRSYRSQLVGTGLDVSDDPTSFAYIEDDSWLLDYDALVAAYTNAFGPENVVVLDYDEVVNREGSVIPAFAELVGLSRDTLPALDRYFLNRTGSHIRLPEEHIDAIRRGLAERYPP